MENRSSMAVSTASADVSDDLSTPIVSSSSLPPPPKKKRNLPGMPDPEAEVIALSPKSLLATNRFLCEICGKGFQRDQNLQLHRRGHNLPWKLKQRTGNEVRKRVYVCPEPSCVHHNASRALGDLTGIKKHFSRKHGDKKWKCERCSKKYAVHSDLKAHLKTCGTKEYKCDCGTVFSRRDSFITHRAFCDALAEESAKAQKAVTDLDVDNVVGAAVLANSSGAKSAVASPPPPPPHTPSTAVVSPALSVQSSDLPDNPIELLPAAPALAPAPPPAAVSATATTTASSSAIDACASNNSNDNDKNDDDKNNSGNNNSSNNNSGSKSKSSVFASIFASSSETPLVPELPQASASSFSNLVCPIAPSNQASSLASSSTAEPTSLSLFLSSPVSSLFSISRPEHDTQHLYAPPPQPAMSATALLQKAAQMGAAASNGSWLRGLGLTISSSSGQESSTSGNPMNVTPQWSGHVKVEKEAQGGSVALGAGRLGIGLPCQGSYGLTDMMVGSSSLFGNEPMTLDFLGLGMGPSGAAIGSVSALMTGLEGGFNGSGSGTGGGGGNSGGDTWNGVLERKSNGPSFL